MSMTHAQAEKWWNYVGAGHGPDAGQVSKQVQPFKDVFELQYQPNAARVVMDNSRAPRAFWLIGHRP